MPTILFPTDFSEAAENAYVYALRLAAVKKADVLLLHAYELPSIRQGGLSHTLSEFYENLNLEEFENFRDKLPKLDAVAEQHGLGHVARRHALEEGRAVSSILRYAEAEQVELIVMGTTGATGAKEVFLGSVAGEILENAPCPTLAVPKSAEFDGTFDHFAFATGYAEEHKRALRWFSEWSKPFPARVEVVHVDLNHTEGLTESMDKFSADLSDLDRIDYTVIDATDFADAMTEYLEECGVDFLALVTHRRGFWAELFNRSRTKELSYRLKLPVMALPEALFAA